MISWTRRFGISVIVLGTSWPLVGCDREIMEAETPSGQEIEVEQDPLDGDIEVETDLAKQTPQRLFRAADNSRRFFCR